MASFGPFVELSKRGQVGWLREDVVVRDAADGGLDRFWRELAPLPGAKGRGGVGVLQLDGRELVVRPYRRGGALGSVLHDRYLSPARARDELQVLSQLELAGVPVVAPIAAVARRHGLFWRLRLCTERLAGAEPTPAFLAAFPRLRRSVSAAVGELVQRAFAVGLRHPDLHLDNVLCAASPNGEARAVLVDLDRAKLEGSLSETARDEMLVRMQRYVVRHRSRLATVPSRAETMRFLRELWSDPTDRHAAWRRLAAKLQRALDRRSRFRRN